MNDNINKPAHYRQHELEAIDEMIIMFGKQAVRDFCKCNAWKYRYRADFKGKKDEDYKKADWYIKKAKEIEDSMYWDDEM